MSNSNFEVRGTSVKVGSGPNPTWKLDWIPATVDYTQPPSCTRANPTVLISPDSQNATAGSTLTYDTSVTNNDSNGCGSSIFAMSYSIPSGWTGSFTNYTLTISPGQSQSTTFSITSSVNTTSGSYIFTNTATNNNAPSYSGNDTAVYVVI